MNPLHETRDAILGELDVLNIKHAVNVYSSKHAALTPAEKEEAVQKYTEQLTLLLEDDFRLQKVHTALYDLDQFIDSHPVPNALTFAQTQVTLRYQDINVEVYIFQVGYIRFLKEIVWGVK